MQEHSRINLLRILIRNVKIILVENFKNIKILFVRINHQLGICWKLQLLENIYKLISLLILGETKWINKSKCHMIKLLHSLETHKNHYLLNKYQKLMPYSALVLAVHKIH